MIETVERGLRRSWHHLRRRAGLDLTSPTRLTVEKSRWLHDARSPVMLMVDDLTNAWHAPDGADRWEPGGDWGGGLDSPGSAFRGLVDRLLTPFPEAKVTFFVVSGAIAAYTHDQPFRYAAPLDADDRSRRFFASLAANPRFELAYHGHNHGTPGDRTEEFVQEYLGFPTREAAMAQTEAGLSTFCRATGQTPRGGKYGGWAYNDFADAVVDECGFLWWCRDWMPRDVSGLIADGYYEPQFFGRGPVVALPSTVHGHFWDRRQIDLLLERQQVIAVEEHIAPVRPDGLVQTPNIADDIEDLRRLYEYLRDCNVWHATGTEIASYVVARERSLVCDVTHDGFTIRYDGRVDRPLLTLLIDCSTICSPEQPLIEVVAPDGSIAESSELHLDRERYRHRLTVRVSSGRYQVRPVAAGRDQ